MVGGVFLLREGACEDELASSGRRRLLRISNYVHATKAIWRINPSLLQPHEEENTSIAAYGMKRRWCTCVDTTSYKQELVDPCTFLRA